MKKSSSIEHNAEHCRVRTKALMRVAAVLTLHVANCPQGRGLLNAAPELSATDPQVDGLARWIYDELMARSHGNPA